MIRSRGGSRALFDTTISSVSLFPFLLPLAGTIVCCCFRCVQATVTLGSATGRSRALALAAGCWHWGVRKRRREVLQVVDHAFFVNRPSLFLLCVARAAAAGRIAAPHPHPPTPPTVLVPAQKMAGVYSTTLIYADLALFSSV